MMSLKVKIIVGLLSYEITNVWWMILYIVDDLLILLININKDKNILADYIKSVFTFNLSNARLPYCWIFLVHYATDKYIYIFFVVY